MSFEIHLSTITTGSLSLGLKILVFFTDSWVFSGLSISENVKKACSILSRSDEDSKFYTTYRWWKIGDKKTSFATANFFHEWLRSQRMSMNGFFEQMEQEEITQVAKDHYLSTNFQVPPITTSLTPGTLTELIIFGFQKIKVVTFRKAIK